MRRSFAARLHPLACVSRRACAALFLLCAYLMALHAPAFAGQKPSTPTGLAATPGNAKVTLTWNSSSGATAYNVKRSTTSGTGYTTIASPTTTSYTDTGVTNGTTYYYVVSAKNSSGESANSSQVSATPVAPPAAPTNLAATSGNTQVALTWTASSTATSYNVKRSTTSGSGYSTIGTSASASYTDKAVSNTVTYYYVVTGVNAGGEGGNSNQATGNPTGPPSPPLTFTANGGYQQVALSWSSSPSATSYNLYRSTTSGAETLYSSGITGTSFTDTPLPNTTTYYYKIAAVGSLGTGLLSSEVSATTYSCAPPAVPSNVTATPHGCEVDLLFYIGSGATVVTVYRGTSPTSLSYLGSFNMSATGAGYYSYSDYTPANGTTYYYGITALGPCSDGSGATSAMSSPVSATPQAPQGATNITATATSTQVTISWCNGANAMQQGYDIERATTSGGPYSVIKQYATTDSGCHSYVDTGLTNGTTYYYVIAPYSNCGTGAISAQVSATPQPPPAAPTSLAATASGSNINLTWTASTGATSYNVKRSTTTGGPYTTIGTSATASYADATATPGTTFYYVVSAVSQYGESANSSQASAHTSPANGTPVYQINSGGAAVPPFVADEFYSAGNSASTQNWVDTSAVAVAAPTAVYETQRYGSFTYSITGLNPSTAYTVRLHFAEIYYTTGGSRIEDVTVNGTKVLSGFEVFAAANGPNKAVVEQFNATSDTTGKITVAFAPTTGSADTNPIINGVEVLYGNSAPLAPARLYANPGNGQATLSWTTYGTITSYNVKRATAPGGPYTTVATGVTTTSYTNTGLTNGTLYYYVVTAVNATGESASSNIAVVRSTSATAVLQINCGGPAVSPFVADTDFTSGSTDAPGVLVDVSGVPDAAPQAVYQTRRTDNAAVNYTLPGLTAGAAYTVRLHFAELYGIFGGQRLEDITLNGTKVASAFDTIEAAGALNKAVVEAFNATADSAGKISIGITPATGATNNPQVMGIEVMPGYSPPSPPYHLTALPDNNKVTLNWSAVSNWTSFSVLRGSASGGPYSTVATGLTSTSYVDTTAQNGTAYYYAVTAANAQGTSQISNEAAATPLAAGAEEYRINCGGYNALPYVMDDYFTPAGAGAVDTIWTYSPTTGSIDVTNVTNPAPQVVYQSRRDNNGGNTPAVIYVLPNLTPGGTYTLRLQFAEYTKTAPGQRYFDIVVNGTKVISNFDLFAAAGGEYKALALPIVTTADANGNITLSLPSELELSMINGIEVLTGNTLPPGPPTDLQAAAGNTQVGLTWLPPAGTAGPVTYNVKRSTTSGGPYTTIAIGLTSPSYSDPVNAGGATYYYVVSATNANGEGVNSNQTTPSAPFTLSASPASINIPHAGTALTTVTATSSIGFTNPIALTATGPNGSALPVGLSAWFYPASVSIARQEPYPTSASTGSAKLHVCTGTNLTPGTYVLTITGTSGDYSATTSVTVTTN